jgi:hypothetical protein
MAGRQVFLLERRQRLALGSQGWHDAVLPVASPMAMAISSM